MYQLRGRLGRWGFGELYEAVHRETGAHRMLKVVRGRRASDPHIRAHMTHEYEVASSCRHPHIVHIEEMEEEPALGIYHVIDLVRGETLGSAVKRGLTFAPKKVLEIMGAATSALAVIEAQGLAHHEFSPESLYLPSQGPSPWVINFGLPPASPNPPPLPLEALAYAAPERKAAQSWDNRADIYSISAVLLQLLVGRPPPPQGWIQFPKPGATSDLAKALHEIARRGLNPTPGQRYPSVAALFGALKALAESEGSTLPPAESKAPPVRPARPQPKRTVLGISALASPSQTGASPVSDGAPPPPPQAVTPKTNRPPKGVKAPTRPRLSSTGRQRPTGRVKKTVLGMASMSHPEAEAGQAALAPTLDASGLGPSGDAWEAGAGNADKVGSEPLVDFDGGLSLESDGKVSLGDLNAGTPLDEISLPGSLTTPGGGTPLAPESFPGGETGAHESFDPSVISQLPIDRGVRVRRRRRLLYGVLAFLGLAAVVLTVLFFWPGLFRDEEDGGSAKGKHSARDAGAARVAERAADAGASGQPGARSVARDAGTGALRQPGKGVDAAVAKADAAAPARPDAARRPGPDETRPSGPAADSKSSSGSEGATSRYKLALSEGRKAMRHHKYRLARRFFTKALRLRPRSSTPKRLMAEAHYRAHEYPAARYWFEQAIKLSPRSASLHARLGKVYAKLGKRSLACRHFVRALALRPNSRRYRMAVQNYRCSK